jgi:hypothetical protein
MSTNFVNQTPFLRTTRKFPEEIQALQVEIDKSYLDIANVVNDRTIGIFPTNRPAITGESWFLKGNQKQQTIRQTYTFTTTASFAHNIKLITFPNIVRAFGSYTDGTNVYGLVYGTSVAVAGQIGFYITSSQVVFTTGAGAPGLTSGMITLEWLSNP